LTAEEVYIHPIEVQQAIVNSVRPGSDSIPPIIWLNAGSDIYLKSTNSPCWFIFVLEIDSYFTATCTVKSSVSKPLTRMM
jgi:hypothetical protein